MQEGGKEEGRKVWRDKGGREGGRERGREGGREGCYRHLPQGKTTYCLLLYNTPRDLVARNVVI